MRTCLSTPQVADMEIFVRVDNCISPKRRVVEDESETELVSCPHFIALPNMPRLYRSDAHDFQVRY